MIGWAQRMAAANPSLSQFWGNEPAPWAAAACATGATGGGDAPANGRHSNGASSSGGGRPAANGSGNGGRSSWVRPAGAAGGASPYSSNGGGSGGSPGSRSGGGGGDGVGSGSTSSSSFEGSVYDDVHTLNAIWAAIRCARLTPGLSSRRLGARTIWGAQARRRGDLARRRVRACPRHAPVRPARANPPCLCPPRHPLSPPSPAPSPPQRRGGARRGGGARAFLLPLRLHPLPLPL